MDVVDTSQQKIADLLVALLSKGDVMGKDIKDILKMVSPSEDDDESAKISEALAQMASAISGLSDTLSGVKASVDDLVKVTRSGGLA
ncbi:hypothetical protein GOB86_10320 [Acetobacter lambici]|uniref:Uncharacterized protein n=1 Tax=Acetobacter lambici TaxID=1332824 RepID=A0ABT1F1A3_9PROT|nr:hypothetical protein [Acetobacter lambici]MCP1242807.1 hypothetical protein [Acetobacter lambici]MCP1258977.1 hypothetical protein [Acetobacter lambici]NHO57444.1 hypothetical protein [Acetobacter lambici]